MCYLNKLNSWKFCSNSSSTKNFLFTVSIWCKEYLCFQSFEKCCSNLNCTNLLRLMNWLRFPPLFPAGARRWFRMRSSYCRRKLKLKNNYNLKAKVNYNLIKRFNFFKMAYTYFHIIRSHPLQVKQVYFRRQFHYLM